MPRVNAKDLLYVSKGKKDRLATLASGESLVARTGYSINFLRNKAVTDRITLAKSILKSAENSLVISAPSYRTVVSRAYYAMYHTTRALTYFVHGGDDFEQHSVLPGNIPKDFPGRARWENKLKEARLERNRADYDPYPRNDHQFKSTAHDLIENARGLMPVARRYLRAKGWIAR